VISTDHEKVVMKKIATNLEELQKISPVRNVLRRVNSNSSSNRNERDNRRVAEKPEVMPAEEDEVPTDGNTAMKKQAKKGKSLTKKKVRQQVHIESGDETEPETFDCEYCVTGGHESVIECEKCGKWGCPECTHLPKTIHEVIGKWGSLHWYCLSCEIEVNAFCNQSGFRSSTPEQADDTGLDEGRVTRLEGMVSRLGDKIDALMEKNENVVKSYAHAVGKNSDSIMIHQPPILTSERQTVKILDEYADRERRKANIIIHNLPESQGDNHQTRYENDKKKVDEIIQEGTGVTGVNVSKLVRLGGRGQNQHQKPRLLLVTLDFPDRRRAILAAAKLLRHTEKWSNIYISPDLTPTERESEKNCDWK
jgi:hypothetical protein